MTRDNDCHQAGTNFLSTKEGNIAFDITVGGGPLVLLVPGMGDLRSSYRHLAPLLVAAGYTVVATDLRGHGDSDATFSHYGDEDTANDIAALIESLHEPAFIVGNSMAAGAAVLVAATRPDLVSGIVLIGPFVRQPASSNALSSAFLRVLMAAPWAASAWKAYLPKLYAGTKPVDFEDYRGRLVAAIRRPGYAKAFSMTTRTSHTAAGSALARVSAPTLVIMGQKDPDFKDAAAEARWIGSSLNGSVVMVPEAGHYPQSQQPQVTATAIIDFLAETTKNG